MKSLIPLHAQKLPHSRAVRFGLLVLCFLSLQTIFHNSTTLRAATVVLVANANVPVTQLTQNEVKNIFLIKIKTVQGVRVRPIMLKTNDLTALFLKENVKKTPSQFSNYYKKMIFTGRGRPPKRIVSEQDMLSYVNRTNGAIGYVSQDAVTDSVKIIQVVE